MHRQGMNFVEIEEEWLVSRRRRIWETCQISKVIEQERYMHRLVRRWPSVRKEAQRFRWMPWLSDNDVPQVG